MKRWITDGPFALKVACFLACSASCAVSVLSCLSNLLNPAGLAVSAYTAILAFTGMLLEIKPVVCTRGCKRRLEFWVKASGRVWGRALLYVLLGCLQLAEGGFLPLVCACAMFVVAFFSFIISSAASSKLNALHRAVTAAHGTKVEHIHAAFQEADSNRDGTLDSSEFALVAKRLGTELSPDELRAIFELLDQDGSGKVDLQEFTSWWTGDKSVDYSAV